MYLLVAISAVLIIGSLLPKIAYMQPHELANLKQSSPYKYKLAEILAPQYVVRSIPFIIVWILLLNSTVVCTYRRVKGHFKLRSIKINKGIAANSRKTEGSPVGEIDVTTADTEFLEDQVGRVLKQNRWNAEKIKDDNTAYFAGIKGAFGFWGSILFHVSLILLFVGAGVSGLTRFDGGLLLTEGQPASLADKLVKIAQEPVILKDIPSAIISLKKIQTKYGKSEQLTDISAEMAIASFDGKYVSDTAKVNKPVRYGKYSLLPEKYGITPGFELKDSKGNVIDAFYTNLGDGTPKTWTEKGTFDSFYFNEQDKNFKDLRVKVQFIPNLFIKDKKVFSKGSIIKNPAMILTIINDKKNKEIATNLVKKGESIKFNGYELVFTDLIYWGYFRMVKDLGMPIITFALIFGLIGLSARFIYHEKNIWIKIGQVSKSKAKIEIGGKSKYFPSLFDDELKKVLGYIQERIS